MPPLMPDLELVQRLVTVEQSLKTLCEKISQCTQSIDNIQIGMKSVEERIASKRAYLSGVKSALYVTGLVFVYLFADDMKGFIESLNNITKP